MFAPIYARLCRDLAASAGIQRDLTTACKDHFMENYQQLLHYNNIFEVSLTILLFYICYKIIITIEPQTLNTIHSGGLFQDQIYGRPNSFPP